MSNHLIQKPWDGGYIFTPAQLSTMIGGKKLLNDAPKKECTKKLSPHYLNYSIFN